MQYFIDIEGIQMFNTRRRRSIAGVVSVLAVSSLIGACSSDSSSSDAPSAAAVSAAAESSAAPVEESAATVSGEVSADALSTAWADDWGKVGLTNPGLTPTDAGIVEVDTAQYTNQLVGCHL
jgi:hypothetical protein